eukprot:scaffold2313_cov88-Skeletonema_dohrnii-CCMP3373.AAC.1
MKSFDAFGEIHSSIACHDVPHTKAYYMPRPSSSANVFLRILTVALSCFNSRDEFTKPLEQCCLMYY